MEKYVIETLKDLGVPANLLGYKYLKTAIMKRLEDKDEEYKITTLYDTIAHEHDSAYCRVERCIRHAIEVSCLNADYDTWFKMFRYSYSVRKVGPTNKEFVDTVVEYIRVYLLPEDNK